MTVGRVLRPRIDSNGYACVSLWEGGVQLHRRVHQLVAHAFIGPQAPGMEVCHINGHPADNRLENLRYGTPTQNSNDRIIHGTANRGERHGMAKLTKNDVLEIRRLIQAGHTHEEIAPRYGITANHVGKIRHRERWGWLEEASNS